MKTHVYRPLIVVLFIIAVILIAQFLYVPKDFGVHERGYMYGWYRQGNVEEWSNNIKVKYQGTEYCKECHPENYDSIMLTPHAIIECENCHGPAVEHPAEPLKLVIDRTRDQCLRCHSLLPYPTSGRAAIKGVDPDEHNADIECISCHNPHSPSLEGLK